MVERARNLVMALLGAAGLLVKQSYHGPFQAVVHSHGGNFSVSFALYFAAVSSTSRHGHGRSIAAAITLLAVEAFEFTDGFGIMENTYDPVDYLANALGVGAAVATDHLSGRILYHFGVDRASE
jgi:hypothetical protein